MTKLDIQRGRGQRWVPASVAGLADVLLVLMSPSCTSTTVETPAEEPPAAENGDDPWLRTSVRAGDWTLADSILLGDNPWPGRIDRVDDLSATLADPTLRLDFYDWILGPAPDVAGMPPRRFEWVRRLGSQDDDAFATHLYRGQRPTESRRTVNIDFTRAASARALGRGWSPPDGLRGRRLGVHTGVFLPLRPGSVYEVELVFLVAAGDPGTMGVEWNRAELPEGAFECDSDSLEAIAGVEEAGPYRCRLTVAANRIRERVDALTLEPRDADLWLRRLSARAVNHRRVAAYSARSAATGSMRLARRAGR